MARVPDHPLKLDLPSTAVSDPAVRRQLDDACQALPFDAHVFPVKAFRADIALVRDKAAKGAIVVVSDRAAIRDAADTTVVLSLATLHQTLADVIQKAFDAAKRRGRPADMLIGLPPGPVSRAGLELDFDRLAKAEAAEGADLTAVKHAPVPAVDPVAR